MTNVETRIHPETGAVLRRCVQRRKLDYKGVEREFDVPGWWPADEGGDGILEANDIRVMDAAYRELRAEAAERLKAEEVRRIRTRLKLSQRRAGEILGGGPRAFQKYESGEVVVSRPMANLLLLLDRDPSRLKELIAEKAA
jgi:HTH-type transcriptional regulator/antitoxin MqsA